MTVTTTTNVSAIVPERWELKMQKARYAKAILATRMTTASETLLNYGDIYHFPLQGKLTGGTVSANADFDTEAVTATDNTVTVNTWEYVAFEIPFKTKKQANLDVKEQYAPAAGERLAEMIDIALAATAATYAVGSDEQPIAFGDDLAFAAMLKLADTDIPEDSLSFFLPPIAFLEGLFKKDRWTTADKTGLPKSVLTTGYRFPILGVPAYQSTVLAKTTNSIQAILAHKDWQGLVTQIKAQWETASGIPGKRATNMHFVSNLYGYGALRSDHAVKINVKKSSDVQ